MLRAAVHSIYSRLGKAEAPDREPAPSGLRPTAASSGQSPQRSSRLDSDPRSAMPVSPRQISESGVVREIPEHTLHAESAQPQTMRPSQAAIDQGQLQVKRVAE